MTLRILLDLYALLVGLVTGSYLNVVVHRLPRGLSTVVPRSRCPGCGTPIRPLDNLPVVSWLLLRGRCRACGALISPRYPLIEAFTGLLFVACLERFGATPGALVGALFCALMIALAAIDVEHFLLPDRITLPGIAVGLALQPFTPWATFTQGIVGALVGAGVLLAAYGGWWLLRREEGLGLGDVKMLAMIGAFLGWRGVVIALFLGALSGALFGLALVAVRGGGMRVKLPFGVFLACGALVALFAGRELLELYVAVAFPPPGAVSP